MSVYVDHFSYALGDLVESVEDCAARGATKTDADTLRELGFERHHICHQMSAYDLAHAAVAPLSDKLADVRSIIYSTCLPGNANIGSQAEYEKTRDVKHLMEFPASRLQADFEIRNSEVLGVSQQACTGLLGSIRTAAAFINSEPCTSKVLCVSADRFPEGALYEQSYCLISDGGTACIVSREPSGYKYLAHYGTTNGGMAKADDDETLTAFVGGAMVTIGAAIANANLHVDDIDWVIPQNTAKSTWDLISSLVLIDSQKFYCPTTANYGHMISGDNVLNLRAAEKNGLIKSGQKIVLFTAGYGLNWQAIVLERV